MAPYSIVGNSGGYGGQLLITCEHASKAVPAPLTASDADQRWLDDHWGWDIGAPDVVRELARLKDCIAVLCGFSRLVLDPNRDLAHKDLIRREIYGEPLSFNVDLDQAEIDRRISELYEPYHAAIDREMAARLAAGGDMVLLSIHSFTPQLDDDVREMEIGVLYDNYDAVAERLADNFTAEGFVTALNEPYSGRTGLIFAANRHGREHGVIYIELEIRQDLIDTPEKAIEVARRMEPAITRLQIRGRAR
ncbi:MAG: N-formylglutamate amidohydrolase [Myxococcales bacterium]|nr:N-formylglutamate amidohydrolase [Myxococcales bacterium]